MLVTQCANDVTNSLVTTKKVELSCLFSEKKKMQNNKPDNMCVSESEHATQFQNVHPNKIHFFATNAVAHIWRTKDFFSDCLFFFSTTNLPDATILHYFPLSIQQNKDIVININYVVVRVLLTKKYRKNT